MRFLLILLVTIFSNSCVSNKPGKWMPFLENSSTSEELGKKYDVPNINHNLDGLIYWQISPRIDTAPYAFHWIGNKLLIWEPDKENITRYTIFLDKCPNLKEQIFHLIDKIGDSAKMMSRDKYRNSNAIFVGSPIEHRIKYYPPDMLGSITLRNIEFYQMPWIEEAQKVRKITQKCIK